MISTYFLIIIRTMTNIQTMFNAPNILIMKTTLTIKPTLTIPTIYEQYRDCLVLEYNILNIQRNICINQKLSTSSNKFILQEEYEYYFMECHKQLDNCDYVIDLYEDKKINMFISLKYLYENIIENLFTNW
jgi:hypothetical protein